MSWIKVAIKNLHCSLGQPVWYAKIVVHCRILQVIVSTKSVITSKIHRKRMKYDEKVHAFLTKADIFTKLVNANVATQASKKPLYSI